MSVKIKGMRMPDNCPGCAFYRTRLTKSVCIAKPHQIPDEDFSLKKRSRYCPLEEEK
jgi:hypothetical protein